MKIKLLIPVITGTVFFLFTIISSCKSPTENVEKAQENVVIANQKLEQANKEYLMDIENYKKANADKIKANDLLIADYNAKVDLQKKTAKEEYKKKIAELQQKNNDLKKKMDEYKEDGKEKWESFKSEFSHDMDQLGEAFKGFTVNNVK